MLNAHHYVDRGRVATECFSFLVEHLSDFKITWTDVIHASKSQQTSPIIPIYPPTSPLHQLNSFLSQRYRPPRTPVPVQSTAKKFHVDIALTTRNTPLKKEELHSSISRDRWRSSQWNSGIIFIVLYAVMSSVSAPFYPLPSPLVLLTTSYFSSCNSFQNFFVSRPDYCGRYYFSC